MAEIGVMVYGFSKEAALEIREYLERINGEEVALVSGSGREEDIVGDILEDEGYDTFIELEDPRVVMFLGFDGPRIHASMDGFPSLEGGEADILHSHRAQHLMEAEGASRGSDGGEGVLQEQAASGRLTSKDIYLPRSLPVHGT